MDVRQTLDAIGIPLDPQAYNPYPALVRGQWYRVSTFNATFDFWVPRKLSRAEARRAALGYIGDDIYSADDIDSVRAVRQPTA